MRMLKLTLVATILAAFTAGCGDVQAPEADEQVVTPVTVPMPAANPDQPFMLKADQATVTYGGSLLMWDAAVTPTQIAAVAKASVDGRLLKAGNLSCRSVDLAPPQQQSADLTNRRRALAVQIERAKSDGTRIAQVLRPAVASWFEGRLADLKNKGEISTTDVKHARANFAAYCEYKIWELATNPLLKNKFDARPTPLQMCEPYYARAGLFKTDGTLCQDTGSRRDYFSCLWQQGVMETKVFKGKLDTAACDVVGLTRAAAITAWVGTDEFRQALFDTELADGIQSYGELLNAAILARGTIPSEVRAKYPFFADCKKAFKNDLAAPPAATWEYASLLDLKSIVEGPGDGTELYTLLPKNRAHSLLAQPITTFAQRTVTDAAVNDRLFNQNAQGTVRPGDYFYKLYLTAPDFAAVRAEEDQAVPADLRVAASRLDSELASVATQLANAEGVMAARVRDLSQATLAGVKAVIDPGATTLFMSLVISVSRTLTGLDVVLTLGDGMHSMVGCAPYNESTGCIPEADLAAGKLHKNFDLADYNLSSGKLTLDVKLDDLAAIGLQTAPRSSASPNFNALGPEVLGGRVLRLEGYANQVGGSLRIVTGKVLLVEAADRDGTALYEGSFSADDYASQINR